MPHTTAPPRRATPRRRATRYAAAAVAWYRRAAEQGDARAQYNLGGMYREGRGVPPDAAGAVAWYRRAAEQGHVRAQYNLGGMYAEGLGVPPDAVEAFMWLTPGCGARCGAAGRGAGRCSTSVGPATGGRPTVGRAAA